jgi:hypothetical protein
MAMSQRKSGPPPSGNGHSKPLTDSPLRCTETIMLAHGFTVEILRRFVLNGLATATPGTFCGALLALRGADSRHVQLDPLLCTSIPAGITTQQLVDVVVTYGETFPELTNRPFTVLAMSAMRVAWPCKK